MSAVVVVQARMESTRLPGKVLYPAPGGVPLLEVLARQVQVAREAGLLIVDTVLAIPDTPANEVLAGWGRQCGFGAIFRGSADDVLGRVQGAVVSVGDHYETVVRLTADCPLVLPETINELVEQVESGTYDYARTGESYPEGLDVEVFTRSLLERAHREARLPAEREHVTLWMRRHVPAERQYVQEWPGPEKLGHIRLTVDYPEDYEVVWQVLELLNDYGDWTRETLLQLVRFEGLDGYLRVFEWNAHIRRNEWLEAADRERHELPTGSRELVPGAPAGAGSETSPQRSVRVRWRVRRVMRDDGGRR